MRLKEFLYSIAMHLARTKSDFKNQLYWNKKGRILRRRILEYYSVHSSNLEEKEVVGFLKRNRISLLPYDFTKLYKSKNVVVKYEQLDGFPYVEVNKKRLYYRKDWTKKQIQFYHANLLAEQDPRSPHCYQFEGLNSKTIKTAIDAGGAEGIFSLSIIDIVNKIYIVEPNPKWNEALERTFSPWKEKVIILKKYLSDTISENSISIDHYFDVKEIDLIKIDVEGYERQVLKGGIKLLTCSQNLQLIIAAYHIQDDGKVLDNMLVEFGFETNYSAGFILFFYDIEIENPLLRRGLIYAKKENSRLI